MKAAGKSDWATYAALAVAAALACLLIMSRPLPAGLRTTWVGCARPAYAARAVGVHGRASRCPPRQSAVHPCAISGQQRRGARLVVVNCRRRCRCRSQAAADRDSCLLALALITPPNLVPIPAACSLHFRLEEPAEPGAGIEVAVTARDAQPRVEAATLSAGPRQQASLAQPQQQAQLAGQAVQAQPEQAGAGDELQVDDKSAPEQPAEKVAAEAADEQQREAQQADSEQQKAQLTGSQPAAEQETQQAAAQEQAATQQEQAAPAQQAQPEQEPQPAGQQAAAAALPQQPPAKRGIDIFREFQANVSSCFQEWAGLECLRQQQDWVRPAVLCLHAAAAAGLGQAAAGGGRPGRGVLAGRQGGWQACLCCLRMHAHTTRTPLPAAQCFAYPAACAAADAGPWAVPLPPLWHHWLPEVCHHQPVPVSCCGALRSHLMLPPLGQCIIGCHERASSSLCQ